MTRLAADAAHQFGGVELDRTRPLRFRLDGQAVAGFAGDTVLSATLAAGIDTAGTLAGYPLALTPSYAPAVTLGSDPPMPMEVAPAIDGLSYRTVGSRRRAAFTVGRRTKQSLGHDLSRSAEPDWQRQPVEETLEADLLVVGGGVAGLAAAEAAAAAGRTVIVCERRPWLGGDARYYGPVGDDEAPEALISRLVAGLAANRRVTLLARANVHSLGQTSLVHQVVPGDHPRGRMVLIAAGRIVIASGTRQRLPVFPGNRLPGVMPSIEAYHLAKRYGVARGDSALVATQGNFGYRFALRLNDAGIGVKRVVDVRLNPQSRFVDFAKASGLMLSSGQLPITVTAERTVLRVSLGNVGTAAVASSLEVDQLVLSGGHQPDLALWMRVGGRVEWNGDRLAAVGHVEHAALAGAAAGWRSMKACVASGRAAVAALFGGHPETIEDAEVGSAYETSDVPFPASPIIVGPPAFLDAGRSLAQRNGRDAGHELSVGDVAAGVELGNVAPGDAGAVAEERGAPGADVTAATWAAPVRPVDDMPAWLVARFGDDPARLHLVVDGKRRFERGSLIYANTGPREPVLAVGVILAQASPGGVALISREALGRTDRFVVQGLRGVSPARIAPGEPRGA